MKFDGKKKERMGWEAISGLELLLGSITDKVLFHRNSKKSYKDYVPSVSWRWIWTWLNREMDKLVTTKGNIQTDPCFISHRVPLNYSLGV